MHLSLLYPGKAGCRPLSSRSPGWQGALLGLLLGAAIGFALTISAFNLLAPTLGMPAALLTLAIGVLLGALSGAAIQRATPLHPPDEDAYWQQAHTLQSYAHLGDYARFALAYQLGYLGQQLYGQHSFAEAEPILRREYERMAQGSVALPWQLGRQAALAAWERARRWQA